MDFNNFALFCVWNSLPFGVNLMKKIGQIKTYWTEIGYLKRDIDLKQ